MSAETARWTCGSPAGPAETEALKVILDGYAPAQPAPAPHPERVMEAWSGGHTVGEDAPTAGARRRVIGIPTGGPAERDR